MIVCIVGPTGVGKTKLSILLAKYYDAIVINGDSCQIYKELNIGTAKIKEEEKEGIKHYLLNIKNPNEDYSVAEYQKDIRKIIKDNQNRNIIIVGGTGLYLTAALYNYEFSSIKDIDFSNYSNEELYQLCLNNNKDIKVDINNRRRLENYLKREEKPVVSNKLIYDNVFFVVLTTNREKLYEIINKRVDKMIDDGLIDEVKQLYNKYGMTNILSRAIGYKEIIKYLHNEISLEETTELIKKNSRHYAKRQYTWFNNKMNVTWFQSDFKNFNNTYEEVINYLDKYTSE